MRSPGALVLSLDFELHWGVRPNRPASGPYRTALLATREAIDRTLEVFDRRGISATWATVGMLFTRSRAEWVSLRPALRPAYTDTRLDPYREPIGLDEADDPLHFAPTVIEWIRKTPGQEIATHTYSHFFTGEAGATVDAFRADMAVARAVARDRGISLRSIVFPRNQALPEYVAVLPEFGIDTYRGNPPGSMWHVEQGNVGREPLRRLARLVDTYVPIADTDMQRWSEVVEPSGLANVRASRFLRPSNDGLAMAEPLRLARIRRGMERAAREGGLYHLWWHPHNFGTHPDGSLAVLEEIIAQWARLRDKYGFESLNMAQAAERARALQSATV